MAAAIVDVPRNIPVRIKDKNNHCLLSAKIIAPATGASQHPFIMTGDCARHDTEESLGFDGINQPYKISAEWVFVSGYGKASPTPPKFAVVLMESQGYCLSGDPPIVNDLGENWEGTGTSCDNGHIDQRFKVDELPDSFVKFTNVYTGVALLSSTFEFKFQIS